MKLLPAHRAPIRLDDAAASIDSPYADKDALKDAIQRQAKRISELQQVLYADRSRALLIVLQGRDASGKDGTIRKVFSAVNPQGCSVSSFGVPTELEQRHDYLWRIHQQIPPRGMIGIFNRSHYEDILVPQVRKWVSPAVIRERYQQINDFESMLVANGVVILKFMLHVSRAEQKSRLEERLTDPEKNWKFREGDLEDRKRWDDFTTAYRGILKATSTDAAPWFVVPSDSNKIRNLLVATTIADALARLKLKYPAADPAIKKLKVA